MSKIWANSADSHVLEPADLWLQSLPSRLARRAPRAERGDKYEILYIDGERMDRQLNDFMDAMRPPGARDLGIRLKDLDQEGVWGQLAFPSMGFWTVKITDRELARETVRAWNDWAHAEILSKNKRVIPHRACVSTADIGDAVAELERAAGLGFQAVFLPSQTRPGEEYATLDRMGAPLWAAAERVGVVLGFHIIRDRRGRRRVPRAGRRHRQLASATVDLSRRCLGRVAHGGKRGPGPSPGSCASSSPRRCRVGARDRGPDERGLPPARHVRPAQAEQGELPGEIIQPAGLRVLPARQERGSGGTARDRVPQRAVQGDDYRTSRAPTATPRKPCAACSLRPATRSATGSPAAPSTSCSGCPPRHPRSVGMRGEHKGRPLIG